MRKSPGEGVEADRKEEGGIRPLGWRKLTARMGEKVSWGRAEVDRKDEGGI